jgi:hypothetical protein
LLVVPAAVAQTGSGGDEIIDGIPVERIGVTPHDEAGAVRNQNESADERIGSHAHVASTTVPALSLPPSTADGHRLGRNIPNPAHSITRIPFVAPQPETVLLTMYDSKGREIARHSLEVAQGMNTIDLDVSTLPAGSYLYQITAGRTVLTRMMTVTP